MPVPDDLIVQTLKTIYTHLTDTRSNRGVKDPFKIAQRKIDLATQAICMFANKDKWDFPFKVNPDLTKEDLKDLYKEFKDIKAALYMWVIQRKGVLSNKELYLKKTLARLEEFVFRFGEIKPPQEMVWVEA